MRKDSEIGIRLIFLWLFAIVVASCSTTSSLVEGEQLYTGVDKFEVTPAKGEKVPDEVDTYLFDVINVKPNNSLYSPYIRSPFPIGLWVYNHWSPNSKGLKGWLYETLVEQPVVIDDVNPTLRVGMMKSVLDNHGYFSGTARYELINNKKNPKKAELSYFIEHDELEKVSNAIIEMKSHIETETFTDAIAELEEGIFVLKHIQERNALDLKNIF